MYFQYATHAGTVKESDVIKILNNDPSAKQLWAEARGCQLNKVQIDAIKLSSKVAFQLIQGPPGKIVCGIYIIQTYTTDCVLVLIIMLLLCVT